MARSQESFGKKEREKKKQKKKLEKEKKKENREKQSLDDMIAYVDEHSNINSTPPDPTKKKEEVKLEDIEISVSRKEDMDPEDLIRKGVVSYFNENKGSVAFVFVEIAHHPFANQIFGVHVLLTGNTDFNVFELYLLFFLSRIRRRRINVAVFIHVSNHVVETLLFAVLFLFLFL